MAFEEQTGLAVRLAPARCFSRWRVPPVRRYQPSVPPPGNARSWRRSSPGFPGNGNRCRGRTGTAGCAGQRAVRPSVPRGVQCCRGTCVPSIRPPPSRWSAPRCAAPGSPHVDDTVPETGEQLRAAGPARWPLRPSAVTLSASIGSPGGYARIWRSALCCQDARSRSGSIPREALQAIEMTGTATAQISAPARANAGRTPMESTSGPATANPEMLASDATWG